MLNIKKIREVKNITQDEMVAMTGIPKRSYVDYENGKSDIQLSKLQKIATVLNVSIGDLVGETKNEQKVIKLNDNNNDNNFDNKQKVTKKLSLGLDENYHLIPLYDGVVTAGMRSVADLSPQTEPAEYINAGDWFRDATAAMRIHDDSMFPEYKSGSIAALKAVNNKQLIIYGQDYVIETSEYRVIKRLQRSDQHGCWLLASVNTDVWETGPLKGRLIHEPFDVPIDEVTRLFRVLGCVKRNESSKIMYSTPL